MEERPVERAAKPETARKRGFPWPVAVVSLLCMVGGAGLLWWNSRDVEVDAASVDAGQRRGLAGDSAAPLAEGNAALMDAAAVTADAGAAVANVVEAADDDPAVDEPATVIDRGGLTRADVVAAISAVRPQLARCPKEPALIGVVRLTVSSSGRVGSAQALGGLANTPAGVCAEGVARAAVFRSSHREQTVVRWPIAIGKPPVADEPQPAAK